MLQYINVLIPTQCVSDCAAFCFELQTVPVIQYLNRRRSPFWRPTSAIVQMAESSDALVSAAAPSELVKPTSECAVCAVKCQYRARASLIIKN